MFKPGDLVVIENYSPGFNGLAEVVITDQLYQGLHDYTRVQCLFTGPYYGKLLWFKNKYLRHVQTW